MENIETILEFFEDESNTSTRDAERELGITKSTVHRVLQAEGLHLYHYRRVLCLHENDPSQRLNFCQTFIDRAEADQNYSRRILWTTTAGRTKILISFGKSRSKKGGLGWSF